MRAALTDCEASRSGPGDPFLLGRPQRRSSTMVSYLDTMGRSNRCKELYGSDVELDLKTKNDTAPDVQS